MVQHWEIQEKASLGEAGKHTEKAEMGRLTLTVLTSVY